MKDNKHNKHSKNETGPVILELEAKLAATETEAAPALAKVRELESAAVALKKDLGIFGAMPGVVNWSIAPETDLTPEEALGARKELKEKEVLLVAYNRKLAPLLENASNARSRLKSAWDHVEDRKQRLAKLLGERTAEVKADREKKRLEAEDLMKTADRREEELKAEIAAAIADIQRYEGPSFRPDAVDGKNVTPKQQPG